MRNCSTVAKCYKVWREKEIMENIFFLKRQTNGTLSTQSMIIDHVNGREDLWEKLQK